MTIGLTVSPGGLGVSLRRLLGDPDLANRLGRAAQHRVSERFLPDRHLLQWAGVLSRLGLG